LIFEREKWGEEKEEEVTTISGFRHLMRGKYPEYKNTMEQIFELHADYLT